MKPRLLAALFAGTLALMAAAPSSGVPPKHSQQGASAKADQSGSAAAQGTEPFPQVPRITAEEVQRLVRNKADVVIVDTDDPETYAAEHLRGAVNIAYDPTADARNLDQMLNALPGNKLIVFYCNCAHEEDSAPVVLEMWELGYDRDKVKALKGGLTRWEQLNYPLAGTDVDARRAKGS